MCLNPIKIPNNSRYFRKGIDPEYMEVPCGHCLECQTKVQHDWLVRLYYEYLNSACVPFLTLTYHNDCIPELYLTYKEHYELQTWISNLIRSGNISAIKDFEDKWNIPIDLYLPRMLYAFSSQDILKMVKSLRQILHQEGFLDYSDSHSLKYFCVTEYGELGHRPHYHIMFFLPFKIDPSRFKKFVERAWSFKVDPNDEMLEIGKSLKCCTTASISSNPVVDWNDLHISKNKYGRCYYSQQRGFVNYSDKGEFIKNPSGMSYVTKYVSKKDSFVSTSKFGQLKDYLKLFPSCKYLEDNDNKELAKVIRKLRDCFPFVRSSQGLGLKILNDFNLLSDEEVIKKISEKSITLPGIENMKFSVPQYIINRIMYRPDDCDNTLRVLTPIGLKVLAQRYQDKLQETERMLTLAYSIESKHLSSQEINDLRVKYGVHPLSFASVQNLFNDFSFGDVAMYVIAYRNVYHGSREMLVNFDLQTARDTFDDVIQNRLSFNQVDTDTPPKYLSYKANIVATRLSFNYCDCFRDFDKIYEIARDIHNIVKGKIYRKMKRENENMFLTREYYWDYLHGALPRVPTPSSASLV